MISWKPRSAERNKDNGKGKQRKKKILTGQNNKDVLWGAP